MVPAERLLEYRVQNEWEPFCSSLGLDVPKELFPRDNDKETLEIGYDEVERGCWRVSLVVSMQWSGNVVSLVDSK
jgi:hypothetical protein